LVVKIVGLMFGVTVLGVLSIVGEYTVDSSECDLCGERCAFVTLLRDFDGEALLASFVGGRLDSRLLDTAHKVQSSTCRGSESEAFPCIKG
jgi:hypothetical protein